MKHKFSGLFSLILSFVMIFSLLPLPIRAVYALNINEDTLNFKLFDGAQLRLEGIPGIRFMSLLDRNLVDDLYKSNNRGDIQDYDYGYLFAPTNSLTNEEKITVEADGSIRALDAQTLTLEKVGGTLKRASCKNKAIYIGDDVIVYSVVLVGFYDNQYQDYYTVRPYLTYTDAAGEVHTYYPSDTSSEYNPYTDSEMGCAETVSRSYYHMAKFCLESDKVRYGSDKTVRNIFDTVGIDYNINDGSFSSAKNTSFVMADNSNPNNEYYTIAKSDYDNVYSISSPLYEFNKDFNLTINGRKLEFGKKFIVDDSHNILLTTDTSDSSMDDILTKRYKVTFMVDENVIDSLELLPGAFIARPADPVKEGYNFVSWFTDKELSKEYDFNLGIEKDIVLYAKFEPKLYTVTFDGVEGLEPLSVPYGEKISAPEVAAREGYDFDGWFLKNAAGEISSEAFDFTSAIISDITLSAKFTPKTFTVSFEGAELEPITVQYNEKLSALETPVIEHYVFDGWYADADYTTAFDFNVPITSDVTIYVKLKAANYIVNFHSGIDIFNSQLVEYLHNARDPGVPEKDGNTFDGWYADDLFTEQFAFEKPILANTHVFAKFIAKLYTVTFIVDGAEIKTTQVRHGGVTEMPETPVKSGYIFSGWYADEALSVPFAASAPVSSDLTVYGVFNEAATHTVTILDDKDGEVFKTISVIDKEYIAKPVEVPKKTNMYITNWYDAATNRAYTFGNPITADLTIYPVYDSSIRIGNTKYDTMEAAYEKVSNNGTITLYGDVEMSNTITIGSTSAANGKSFVINGTGTISRSEGFTEDMFVVATESHSVENKDTKTVYTLTVKENVVIDAGSDTSTAIRTNSATNQYKVSSGCSGSTTYNTVISGAVSVNGNAAIRGKIFSANSACTITVNDTPTISNIVLASGQQVKSTGVAGGSIGVTPNGTDTGVNFENADQATAAADFFYRPSDNMSYTASGANLVIGTSTKCSVVYRVDGKEYASVRVNAGNTMTPIEAPEKEGSSFSGWYTDPECTQKFEYSTVISNDIILYAGWAANRYKVTFINSDNSVLKEEYVNYRGSATPPENPRISGNEQQQYTFIGWDGSYTNVTSDVTVKALYSVSQKNYSVIYMNGSEQYAFETVRYGQKAKGMTIAKPGTDYSDYEFAGWYTDEKLTKPYDFNTSVVSDLVLWAKFNEIERKFTAKIYNGTTVVAEYSDLEYGASIPVPEDVVPATGYMFSGWYEKSENGDYLDKPFDFELDKITHNTTLYAVFTQNTYTVTLMIGGEQVGTITVPYNSTVTLPDEYDGYLWYTNTSCTQRFYPTDKITADKIIYGKLMSEDAVAYIGTTAYSDLPTAFEQAGNNATIQLVRSTTWSEPVTLSKNVTLTAADTSIKANYTGSGDGIIMNENYTFTLGYNAQLEANIGGGGKVMVNGGNAVLKGNISTVQSVTVSGSQYYGYGTVIGNITSKTVTVTGASNTVTDMGQYDLCGKVYGDITVLEGAGNHLSITGGNYTNGSYVKGTVRNYGANTGISCGTSSTGSVIDGDIYHYGTGTFTISGGNSTVAFAGIKSGATVNGNVYNYGSNSLSIGGGNYGTGAVINGSVYNGDGENYSPTSLSIGGSAYGTGAVVTGDVVQNGTTALTISGGGNSYDANTNIYIKPTGAHVYGNVIMNSGTSASVTGSNYGGGSIVEGDITFHGTSSLTISSGTSYYNEATKIMHEADGAHVKGNIYSYNENQSYNVNQDSLLITGAAYGTGARVEGKIVHTGRGRVSVSSGTAGHGAYVGGPISADNEFASINISGGAKSYDKTNGIYYTQKSAVTVNDDITLNTNGGSLTVSGGTAGYGAIVNGNVTASGEKASMSVTGASGEYNTANSMYYIPKSAAEIKGNVSLLSGTTLTVSGGASGFGAIINGNVSSNGTSTLTVSGASNTYTIRNSINVNGTNRNHQGYVPNSSHSGAVVYGNVIHTNAGGTTISGGTAANGATINGDVIHSASGALSIGGGDRTYTWVNDDHTDFEVRLADMPTGAVINGIVENNGGTGTAITGAMRGGTGVRITNPSDKEYAVIHRGTGALSIYSADSHYALNRSKPNEVGTNTAMNAVAPFNPDSGAYINGSVLNESTSNSATNIYGGVCSAGATINGDVIHNTGGAVSVYGGSAVYMADFGEKADYAIGNATGAVINGILDVKKGTTTGVSGSTAGTGAQIKNVNGEEYAIKHNGTGTLSISGGSAVYSLGYKKPDVNETQRSVYAAAQFNENSGAHINGSVLNSAAGNVQTNIGGGQANAGAYINGNVVHNGTGTLTVNGGSASYDADSGDIAEKTVSTATGAIVNGDLISNGNGAITISGSAYGEGSVVHGSAISRGNGAVTVSGGDGSYTEYSGENVLVPETTAATLKGSIEVNGNGAVTVSGSYRGAGAIVEGDITTGGTGSVAISGGSGNAALRTGKGAKVYGSIMQNGTQGTLSITGAGTSDDADSGAWIGGGVTRNAANTAGFTFSNPNGSVYGPRVEGDVTLTTTSTVSFYGVDTYIGGENGTITLSGASVYIKNNPIIMGTVKLTPNQSNNNMIYVQDAYTGYLAKVEPANKTEGSTVVAISQTALNNGVNAKTALRGFDYYDQGSSLGITYATPLASTLIMGDKKMTVKANLNYPDGNNPFVIYKVENGGLFTDYVLPEYEGYAFAGWYTAAEGGALFDELGTEVKSNQTLYAHWNVLDASTTYNVTAYVCDALTGFENQFPAVVEHFTVSGGGTVPLGNAPNYYGHTFMGWYTDSGYTQKWDIHDTVTSDMTLYGKWSIKPYVTYAEVGGKDSDGNVSVFEAVHNPNNVVYMSLPIDIQLNRNSLKLNISEKATMQASSAGSLENGTFYASSTSNSSTSLKLKAKQDQITSQATFNITSSDGGKSWVPANAADSYIDYNLMGLRTIAKNAQLGDIQNFQLAKGIIKGDESGVYSEKYSMTAALFGTTMTLIFVPETLSDTYKVHYNVLGKDKYTVNLYRDSFAINYTPNYYGYDFEGWYKDAEFTIPWDFENEIITGETTIYAKLEKNELLDGIEPFDYDTNDTWIIKSKGEFQMFASMVTAEGYNFANKTVILDTDIDFNGATIMPIGDSITKFNGTFDGRNHTISNYTAEYMGSGIGLFGNADSKSLLCNIKLKNVTLKSTDSITDGAAALVGHSYGNIINCHVDGLQAAKSRYMGGIVGNTYSNITACSVDNVTIDGYQSHIGGIAGGGVPKTVDCYVGSNVTVKASGGLQNYNYALIGGAVMGDTINCFVNQNSTNFVGKGTSFAGADSKTPTNCYSLSSKAGSTQADYEAKGWVFYDAETNPDGNWVWDSASGTPKPADKLYVVPTAN